MGLKKGGQLKLGTMRCHWWSYSLSLSRCPKIEGVMEISWGSAPWTRVRVPKGSLWEARMKMQSSCIAEPSIFQMSASWNDYQDQQHLWSRASWSPGDKLCVLQRGDQESGSDTLELSGLWMGPRQQMFNFLHGWTFVWLWFAYGCTLILSSWIKKIFKLFLWF